RDPVLLTPKDQGRRVIIVFVDTLRADRLGTYGAVRKTPNIDALADSAVVFEQARSVAPWTLPSVRTAFTGRQPEEWDDARTLHGLLAERGWKTAAYVNNAFIAPAMGMDREWGAYDYNFLHNASGQVRFVLGELDKQPDRDQLVLFQLMDNHLPYNEPEPFASMYVGTQHPVPRRYGLYDMEDMKDPAVRKYASDRYDQTVQFVDSALGELFAALRPDDIVILHSDHGEELWDHGGAEHGHALWDELVRVPLIVRAPGVSPSRNDVPVSLLDLAPTVLDLLGEPVPPEMDGSSLLSVLRGGDGADLRARPQVIGRTLRNQDSWALLDHGTKSIATLHTVSAFDLAKDPGELSPRAVQPGGTAEMREALSSTLGRTFVPVLSVRAPGNKRWPVDGALQIDVGVPVRAAWQGLNNPGGAAVKGNVVEATGRPLPGEIYVLPEVPL
ncbi:MAG: sulfatase-like hydrolase/transferase, partial [Myxococcales bacterium]|nr:sulfatase-like hydrolase/transferase [Myxococcales bacterium]